MTRGARRLARKLAFSSRLLRAHPLRTILGLSGLLVGVAATIVMSAVARGAEARVLARVRALGTDLVIVSATPAGRVAGRVRQADVHTILRPSDATAIGTRSPRAIAVAPSVQRSFVAHANGLRGITTLIGTTTTGLGMRRIAVASGRPFDELEDRERRRVALLGRAVARNLFGPLDPVGRTVQLGRVPFEVIGVLAPRGTDVGGADLDNVVVVPLETALRRVLNVPYVNTLFVQATGPTELEVLEAEVREVLDARHPNRAGQPAQFTVQNQAVLLRTERGATRALRRMTVGVASLALGLGGAGLLAVMLLAARERVREIGLRRAVGASRRDIRQQFLVESALLAAAGGTAGVLAGLAASAVAAAVGPWELLINWPTAALGLAASVGLGIAAGVIPAIRAGRTEPAEALRSA